MLILKTSEQIEKIRKSCSMLASILKTIQDNIKPGVSTKFLNDMTEDFIFSMGAVPAFKNYKGFPYSICASVDDQVVHGFSNDKCLKEGSILSIDCGVILDGWFSDSALTQGVGLVSKKAQRLMMATEASLYAGIKAAQPFCRIGDISYAVQSTAEKYGYGVVREFVGHGVGKDLHEEPQVPNFGDFNEGLILRPGTVIAIEPMLTEGSYEVMVANNGWEVSTRDKKLAAHFEHTIVITNSGPEILTNRY